MLAMDEIPRMYSERLGSISRDQLQTAADRFGLGRVENAEPASGGLFGQNIIITTATDEFVLRGNPHGHVQLTKERCVARFIDERSSLPVPWPYQICDDTEPFGWTYAIMPRLPGASGEALREGADEAERVALATAAGEALARLHEATADAPGPYDGQIDGFIEVDDFPDWALHRLDHWRNACRAVNALSTEAELFIDEVVESCADALTEPFTPVLVHHDFAPGNVNFERRADRFEPTGVFDLMEAYLADGEEDLVRMLWRVGHDERQAFVGAYAAHHPFRPGAGERLAIYALADWLVIWEYARRTGSWFEDEATFVETGRPIVDRARAVAS
jgi:aminoglycoside phosphotransferase (APT) family kinase protein